MSSNSCLNKAKGDKAEGELRPSGPFPKSKKGNTHLILSVCPFSKYVIIKAPRNTNATPIIAVLQETMTIFRQPLRITSDRGTAFTSKEFQAFVSNWGIRHVKTAVRTPRAYE